MVDLKYIITLIEGGKVSNQFLYPESKKFEAIALAKNLGIRYGKKHVKVIEVHDDKDVLSYTDETEAFLMFQPAGKRA